MTLRALVIQNGVLNFYRFEPESLSTFSKEVTEGYKKRGFTLLEVIPIKVRKLSDVLSRYYKVGSIDFFSIDTEGFDYQVLKSNNWKNLDRG